MVMVTFSLCICVSYHILMKNRCKGHQDINLIALQLWWETKQKNYLMDGISLDKVLLVIIRPFLISKYCKCHWEFILDMGDLVFSMFPGSCPETRFVLEKYWTDEPETLLCNLTGFIRFTNDIIWVILTDLFPDPCRTPHINYTPLFIHIGLLPSSLNTSFLLSYLYCRLSLDLFPQGAIL